MNSKPIVIAAQTHLNKPTRGTAALWLFACAFSSLASADCIENSAAGYEEIARGFVFVDDNENGIRDSGEAGLAGVAVSNGCSVVQTDASGAYSLGLSAGEILFITQPSGYRVHVDENQLPRFYYSHYPQGTPERIAGAQVEWQWDVTEATGPLPASIDFAVMRDQSAHESFKAHAFADTQARFELSQDMVREELVNTLIGNPYGVQFGITVGDVMNDNLGLYDRHKRMMALMDIPQWTLPGNHDINFESPNALRANETYKRHYGPTYYSFDVGNVHFVALNNVEYAGAGQRFEDGRYRGRISEDQLTWLAADLALIDSDRFVVIASHIPLITEAQDDSGDEPVTGPYTENFKALLDILTPFKHLYAMAGHDTSSSWKVEVNHSHGWQGDPWLAHTLAEVRGNGWTRGRADERGVRDAMMQDGNPNGFYVMHFDQTRVTPEFIPFPSGIDGGRRLRIMLDPELSAPTAGDSAASINRGVAASATKLIVNLFDGGVRDTVHAAIDDRPAQPMQYRVRTDPLAERIHAQLEGSDGATGTPTRSTHLWELALPQDLEPGIHRVWVHTHDEFGQENSLGFSFELLED